MGKKQWFRARNLGNGIIGVSANGFDEAIGTEDEEKLEIFLTYMAGTSPRKQAKKLVDALNVAVAKYYKNPDA